DGDRQRRPAPLLEVAPVPGSVLLEQEPAGEGVLLRLLDHASAGQDVPIPDPQPHGGMRAEVPHPVALLPAAGQQVDAPASQGEPDLDGVGPGRRAAGRRQVAVVQVGELSGFHPYRTAQATRPAITRTAQTSMTRSARLIFPGCIALKPISPPSVVRCREPVVLAERPLREPVRVLTHGRGVRPRLDLVGAGACRHLPPCGVQDHHGPAPGGLPDLDPVRGPRCGRALRHRGRSPVAPDGREPPRGPSPYRARTPARYPRSSPTRSRACSPPPRHRGARRRARPRSRARTAARPTGTSRRSPAPARPGTPGRSDGTFP